MIVNVNGVSEFRPRDVLLIDMSASDVDLREFCGEQMLEPMVLRGEYFSDQALDVGMAEVTLIPDSELMGKTARDVGFRTRFGLNIVGIKRNGQALEGAVIDQPFQLGDILLVVGIWRQISMLAKRGRDLVVLNMPVEVEDASPAHSQAPHAIFCLVLMVTLMLTDEIPNAIAAILACLLMGKFRCIDAESAYKAIHWPSIILIVGMMPFALALQKTGGVDLVVKGLMDVAGSKGLCHAGLSVCDVCDNRAVYLQYRDSGTDGANCDGNGRVDACLSLSLCHGGGDRRLRRFYDTGLFTGQYPGAGTGKIHLQ